MAILLFFSAEKVSNRMTYALEHAVAPTYRPEVVYDTVVLLGGVSDERVTLEQKQPAFNENVERLIMTHRLLVEGHARTAIVSGGSWNPKLREYSEGAVLAQQLIRWGIAPERVIIEDLARNTHENATYSKAIALQRGFSTVLIVTSAFHMKRAAECFEAVGMKVDTMHVDYRAHSNKSPGSDGMLPRVSALENSSMILREFFGLYIYRFQGYAKPRQD